tara:strand:+ start:278 stop:574 length:297 start_codon:yes stop_codon:yes gene_type:complete
MSRTIGATGRNKKFLLNRLQDMYGDDFHPIMSAAKNAYEMNKIAEQTGDIQDHERASKAWDRIAEYTEPRLKAVEHSGHDGGALQINLVQYDSTDNTE